MDPFAALQELKELRQERDRLKAENEKLREQIKDYCRDNATICYQCGNPDPTSAELTKAKAENKRLQDILAAQIKLEAELRQYILDMP